MRLETSRARKTSLLAFLALLSPAGTNADTEPAPEPAAAAKKSPGHKSTKAAPNQDEDSTPPTPASTPDAGPGSPPTPPAQKKEGAKSSEPAGRKAEANGNKAGPSPEKGPRQQRREPLPPTDAAILRDLDLLMMLEILSDFEIFEDDQ